MPVTTVSSKVEEDRTARKGEQTGETDGKARANAGTVHKWEETLCAKL